MPLHDCTPSAQILHRARRLLRILFALLLLTACMAPPEAEVAGYLLAQRLGTLTPAPNPADPATTGSISGQVTHAGAPVSGATVVVAARTGRPYHAVTDSQGHYTITGVPAGQYVPAAVAPGFNEAMPTGLWGIPHLITVTPAAVVQAPEIRLTPYVARPLPDDIVLTVSGRYTATAPFPPGATSRVTAYRFTATDLAVPVNTLHLYLPPGVQRTPLPMLFMIYPGYVLGWEPVSVGFAAAGYAVVAISPMPEHGVDIEAHTYDARIAFDLARRGKLHPAIAPDQAVLLGGSFTSPILHRFLRNEATHVAAWVTVGGISNAFSLAEDFYAGRVQLPEEYTYAIPALGAPNVRPLLFLRYSPVFTPARLPTLIVHTDADTITPIDQAYQLEAALTAAGIPVETFYYEDVSHNLQIGDDLTDAGREMFTRVVDLARRHQDLPPRP